MDIYIIIPINVWPPVCPLLEPIQRWHLVVHSYNIFITVSIKPRGRDRHRWPSGEGRSLKRGSMNAISQWANQGLSSLGNTRAQLGQASLSSWDCVCVWKSEWETRTTVSSTSTHPTRWRHFYVGFCGSVRAQKLKSSFCVKIQSKANVTI